ncbi:hypothetical protein PAXINDRAFT_14333 [Paxillus involutus ATCC 200175]|uniref:Uncharacterized protein n=1 Tax=Paxillus involutus ATCC 200175 TaxID=664439 RepID=A0A0C9TB11_PAXIN|nr:hypothetical protein PAXINDRAFT_14333 [Paxillus involutus ATCC 200175]
MLSSSEEINPAKLQREEEQHRREAENRIWEAEERRAQRDAEKEKKRVAEEAHKKAEEEACVKAEEEARKRAEEEEAKKKAEEEERKQRQSEVAEKQKKTTGKTMIRPMDLEPGMLMVGSTKSSDWVPGFRTPCAQCINRRLNFPGVKADSKGKACHNCMLSHMSCKELGVQGSSKGSSKHTPIDLTSPRGGKDRKHRRQKSPDYREKKSDDEKINAAAEEREDALGALFEAINSFTEQCREEWRTAVEYREVMTLKLMGVRVALQTMVRAYLDDRVARQEVLGLGLGARGSGEGSGLKEVDLKGKGKGKADPKGKGKDKVVDEEDDMDIAEDKESDGDEEEQGGDGDIEIV